MKNSTPTLNLFSNFKESLPSHNCDSDIRLNREVARDYTKMMGNWGDREIGTNRRQKKRGPD
jgi:hypothetical protein